MNTVKKKKKHSGKIQQLRANKHTHTHTLSHAHVASEHKHTRWMRVVDLRAKAVTDGFKFSSV